MKPLKLSIQAFGPFSKTELIDFSELGATPLFLINGPTGSGKTSILDAICYALYGETTSNERQGTQMRSDQAAIDLLTEVSFEFALYDKRYRVTRAPEQDVPKSRGEGLTVKKHTASLYEIGQEDRLITSKTAQVKGEITNLIGLNETQFRQVMVLPQGKFRELLLASSKDREAIFGQLFQTDMYKKIEFALKEKANSISKAKHDFDNQIRGALQVAEVNTEQELDDYSRTIEEQFNQAELTEKQASDALAKTKQAQQEALEIDQQFALLEKSNLALTEHKQQKTHIDSLKHRIELTNVAINIAPLFNQWQQDNQQVEGYRKDLHALAMQIDQTTQQFEATSETLKLVTDDAKQIPELTQSTYELEQRKLKWVEKEQLDKEITTHVQQKQKLSDTLVKYQALKQTLTDDADNGEKALQDARIQLEQKSPLEVQKSTIERLLTDLRQRDDLQRESARLGELTEQRKLNQNQSIKAHQEALHSADRLEMQWHNGQAAILAQKLSEGEPCPVCGSCEHPSPAEVNQNTVTKKQVEQARNSERLALENSNKISNELAQHIALVEQVTKQLESCLTTLQDNAKLTMAEAQEQLRELTSKLESLNAIDIQKMESDVNTLKQRCTHGEAKIAEVKQQISANDSSIELLNGQSEKLNMSLGSQFQSLKEIELEIVNSQQRIEALNKALESAQKAYQTSQLSLTTLKSEQKTKQQITSDAEVKLAASEQNWKDAFDDSLFTTEEEFQDNWNAKDQQQSWIQTVSDYHNKDLQLNQTLNDLETKLDSIPRPDLASLEARSLEHQNQYDEVRKALDAVRSIHERLIKVKQDITHLHEKNAQLEQEYQVYGTLYDVASGKTGSRISLHRFVLGVLLDDVLIQASHRLNKMSKGRYILTRKTEGFKGAAGRGLDLSVEDGYTGKSRDVATLSGGESFLAALALALGLSDVVQSHSGGIRLDTLFIDEGFGSLDPESLDLALQTLIDLQQSGRTIGLISHVSELKEQMPIRIDVQSSRTGSKIHLVGC